MQSNEFCLSFVPREIVFIVWKKKEWSGIMREVRSTYQPLLANVHQTKIHPAKRYGNLFPDHVANRRASNDHHCHRRTLNLDCAVAIGYSVLANVYPTKYPNRSHPTVLVMHYRFDGNVTILHPIHPTVDSFCHHGANEKKRNETK